MKLAEKIRYLREVEGSLRGLGRPMTQQELVAAVRKEQGKSISQSYMSQIEGGSRPHMTQGSRSLLAKFFKVHPGFLVDDPEGYHTELTSDLRTVEGKLDVWLLQGSERFASDHELSEVLLKAAREEGHAQDACCCWGRFWIRRGWRTGCWKRCSRMRYSTTNGKRGGRR